MLPRLLPVLFVATTFSLAAPGFARQPQTIDAKPKVTDVPEAVVKKYDLDTGFYKKHLDYKGFSILSSAKVSDTALFEARYLIDRLLGEREDILKAMIKRGCRFMVMAPTEMTTDVPEQRHWDKAYWDKRARGMGGKLSSCGEENLLNLKGDRYNKENILIHEFNHAIHQQGLKEVDPTFDGRLKEAYKKAMANKLWKGTYLETNHSEYWAEGVQAYFDCMRPQYGANTREKLEKYDPDLFELVDEVYKQSKFRYVRYDKRPPTRRAEDVSPPVLPTLVLRFFERLIPSTIMWNAQEYLKFATERSRPFCDLLAQVRRESASSIADLGCGPGHLTELLARRWPDAKVLGVDNSPEMLEQAKRLASPGRLDFVNAEIAHWSPAKPLDLLVSNAALQWVPNHEGLIPRLAGLLAPGGTLAVQMPDRFHESPAQETIEAIAADPRWATLLQGVGLHRDSVKPLLWYIRRLHQLGFAVDAWETTYVHVLTGENPVLEWLKGTALRPLLDRLESAFKDEFLRILAKRLEAAYPAEGKWTLFHFPRLFFVATR